MATLIEYPKENNPTTDEWGVMIQNLGAFTGGLLILGVGNINSGEVPTILQGSRIDINGSKYVTTYAENINGSATPNVQNYIYANANGNTATFGYSTTEPQWDPAKGGWYSGNYRAVVKFYFVAPNKYNGKVILDSYNAKFAVNTKQQINSWDAGGEIVCDLRYGDIQAEYNLPPGIYNYTLRGGSGGIGGDGGNGGRGINGTGSNGDRGDDGGIGTEISGTFYHFGGKVQVEIGADGGDGSRGGNGAHDGNEGGGGGGGGAGGRGGDSRIGSIVAPGGKAGRYAGDGGAPNGRDGFRGNDCFGGDGGDGGDSVRNSDGRVFTGGGGSRGGMATHKFESTSAYAYIRRVG